ncbi:hypothetical protein EIP91_001048 [Steccherinum ochraceum]|uniref:Uncharacterized protein n=1 Tax=Steccherinum ochraceum TaxID=92696 RepID=A0A4R0RVD7_9APHY|nr:hypothetical protein EIP91_001048 [Steccherinum ochraceum]
MAPKTNPLPFSETLRDLALLRVSDLDFSSILSSAESDAGKPTSASSESQNAEVSEDVQQSVERSYEFVHSARAALKILNRSGVDREGLRVDDVRSKLEDVLEGLEGRESK